MMTKIIISQDFSSKPFGRYPSDGKWSGERFRDELLIPAFEDIQNKEVVVNLDNVVRGFGSSFLEEAFGGLIRAGFDKEEVKQKLKIESTDQDYVIEINQYIDEA
ncbi:MAG: STAS-like domain-containing protein [Paraglaciecola sp.]|uniref:STAS-like domain-containing protein n=1 Tax=Paraglaciecola sp. TaxID=1920173 RepID=UPI003297E175